MESALAVAVGARLRLSVRDDAPGTRALRELDEPTRARFFRNIDAEVVETPGAEEEGVLAFRHVVDMRAACAAGAWAPWTCVASHEAEDDRDPGAWVMVTRIYTDRVRVEKGAARPEGADEKRGFS